MNLSLLPHLYPPRQMKKVKNKNFKPSIGLAKDSMLKFANVSVHVFVTNFLILIGFF